MTKKILAALALAGAVGLAVLCGCAEKKPTLHIYTWSDYVKPELVQRFEAENGCRVVIDTYASNEEMYAKLKAGATGYDLLFPSSYMVKIMHDQGMLQKLDLDLIPNRATVDPDYMKLAFDQGSDMRPRSVIAQATVMDVNRQAWSGSASLLVHPAEYYVGMRSEPYFVEHGTPIKVDLIVTDLDGNPVADRPVEVTAERLEWKYSGGQWQEEVVDTQTCNIGSATKPVTCAFQTPIGGTYRITAVISDARGRKNRSQITRWVSGGKIPAARKVEQEQATLIPDQETYQPGDVAHILVQSPFSPAEGLLTVHRSGLLYAQRFTIEDGTATLAIPIQEEYIPNLIIQVDLNGSAPRLDDNGEALPGAAPRPAFATGLLNLSIPATQRTLSLEVLPAQKELEPGGQTSLNLALKDASGKPVEGAELAVVVVDEAILALTNYQLLDPISTFYSDRYMDWYGVYGRSSIILANPADLAQSLAGGVREWGLGNGMEKMALPEQPMATQAAALESNAFGQGETAQAQPGLIRLRTDFNPLAVFAPQVVTDDQGKATVTVKLPDNLTRYRVMVAAVDRSGKQFGSGEANLTARLPLMVRPSAPRFLNLATSLSCPWCCRTRPTSHGGECGRARHQPQAAG
jgi:uncharacterized protein YfaS (alpha-2-macroglobulin family)